MATFEEQRLFEECSELRARLTTANKEIETLRRERDEAKAAAIKSFDMFSGEKRARLAAEAQAHALREALDEAEHCLTPATKKLIEVGFWPHEPYALGAIRAALALKPGDALHSDDAAVMRFAVAMREKLTRKRAEGRSGWDGPTCSREYLSHLLIEHVVKGDPLDVGNLAMMLHQRGERIDGDALRALVTRAVEAGEENTSGPGNDVLGKAGE